MAVAVALSTRRDDAPCAVGFYESALSFGEVDVTGLAAPNFEVGALVAGSRADHATEFEFAHATDSAC